MAVKARVVDITASSSVKVVGPGGVLIVESNEVLDLSENEVGFLEGKRTHHHRGIYMQGGIVNPGWRGRLTVELLFFGKEVKIEKGDEIAHVIIFTFDEPVETTRNTRNKSIIK